MSTMEQLMKHSVDETCQAMNDASAAMVAAVLEIERLREELVLLRQRVRHLEAQLATHQEGVKQ